jgi:hypothetical protein
MFMPLNVYAKVFKDYYMHNSWKNILSNFNWRPTSLFYLVKPVYKFSLVKFNPCLEVQFIVKINTH